MIAIWLVWMLGLLSNKLTAIVAGFSAKRLEYLTNFTQSDLRIMEVWSTYPEGISVSHNDRTIERPEKEKNLIRDCAGLLQTVTVTILILRKFVFKFTFIFVLLFMYTLLGIITLITSFISTHFTICARIYLHRSIETQQVLKPSLYASLI